MVKSVSLPKNHEKAHSKTLVSSVSSVLCVWVPNRGGRGVIFFRVFSNLMQRKKHFQGRISATESNASKTVSGTTTLLKHNIDFEDMDQ